MQQIVSLLAALSLTFSPLAMQESPALAAVASSEQMSMGEIWEQSVPVTGIALTGAPKAMLRGETAQLKAAVSPAGTAVTVRWSSSDPYAAKVDKTGKVTATGSGAVTITASAGGVSASAAITVSSYVTLKIGSPKAIQNGVPTTVDDAGTKPFKISGKTMLPLRFVGEKMGGKVSYVNDKTPITMTYRDTTVRFSLKSTTMTVEKNGSSKTVQLDVAAQKKGGKTYIPLRAVSQSLGFGVYYKASGEYIVVSNPALSDAQKDARINEFKKLEAQAFEEFVDLVVSTAEKQPQYPVDNNKRTKYGALFGTPTSAWCTEFVMWCLKSAEDSLGTSYIRTNYPWSSYSGGCVSWFKNRSRLKTRSSGYVPKKGDLIFFDYGTGGATDHTGLVIGTEKKDGVTYVLTIEGNIPTDKVKQIRKRSLPLTDKHIISYGVCRIS